MCLVVLDGWGLAPAGPGNAVSLAHTPVFDELWGDLPPHQLTACGRAVGLPEGQMGNSEVGHLNLGAGAVVRQDLVRIDDAIADGSLAAERGAARGAYRRAQRCTCSGWCPTAACTPRSTHLRALIAMAGAIAAWRISCVHAFTDGRDTLPHAGAGYLESSTAARRGDGRVGIGRSGATGRWTATRRWDRTQRAYDMLVHGRAPHHAAAATQAVRDGLRARRDRRVHRAHAVGAEATIRPGGQRAGFNFRPDRMRELTRALAEPGFGEGGSEELPGWSGRGGARPVSALHDA